MTTASRPKKRRRVQKDLRKVEVYRNLSFKDKVVYSIVRDGIVVLHSDCVLLRYPKFIIRPAGQKRTRDEKKKYVHAVVQGEMPISPWETFVMMKEHFNKQHKKLKDVVYDPFVHDFFTERETGKGVASALICLLSYETDDEHVMHSRIRAKELSYVTEE